MPSDTSPRRTKRWVVGVCRNHHHLGPLELVGAVVDRVAQELGGAPLAAGAMLETSPAQGSEPPLDEWVVGAVHEQASSATARRARGAWYTPRSVVEGLIRVATDDGVAPSLIVDPTCGGGAFILAALDRLVELGLDPEEALGRVAGMDLDDSAVQTTRWSVHLWLGRHLGWDRARELAETRLDIRPGDALVDRAGWWEGPVLIVGNPPFASPLKKGAVPDEAARFRLDQAALLGPYADLGAIHLLNAVESADPGSTVALVQPQSILSSRDTEAMRTHLGRVAPLRALWAARELLFDAGVRACAPVLEVGGRGADEIALYRGPLVEASGFTIARRWSAAAADALGAPRLEVVGERSLGELVSATAGFRDEYYGLVGACREAGPSNGDGGRVVTVGSVDPLTVAWGREEFRFGGKMWTNPVVDRADLPPKVQRWFDRLARPKILLATQAKILEPVIDRSGDLVPATPLIAVLCEPSDLDRVAAVLLAPPISLWAWRRWFGTALSVDSLKLAARQVAELPLPADEAHWAEAAELLAESGEEGPVVAWDRALEVATIMTEAFGAGPEVLAWWSARRKSRPSEMATP